MNKPLVVSCESCHLSAHYVCAGECIDAADRGDAWIQQLQMFVRQIVKIPVSARVPRGHGKVRHNATRSCKWTRILQSRSACPASIVCRPVQVPGHSGLIAMFSHIQSNNNASAFSLRARHISLYRPICILQKTATYRSNEMCLAGVLSSLLSLLYYQDTSRASNRCRYGVFLRITWRSSVCLCK